MTERFEALSAAFEERHADFMGYRKDMQACIEAVMQTVRDFLGVGDGQIKVGEQEIQVVSLAPGAQAPGTPLPEGAPREVLALLAPNRSRAVLQIVLPTGHEEAPVFAMGVPMLVERTANSHVITVGRALDERIEISDLDEVARIGPIIYDLLMQDIEARPTDTRRSGFGFIPD